MKFKTLRNVVSCVAIACWLLLAGCFVGCSNDLPSDAKPVEIVVTSTGLGSASGLKTRGSITSDDILGGDTLSLSMVRIDQSAADGSYLPYTKNNEADGSGQAPRLANLTGYNSALRMRFLSNEFYLFGEGYNNTKLIGWHPAVGEGSVWNVSEDGNHTATVNFTVDGETDILMSNLVAGNKNNKFDGSDNILTFDHLLTRFRVRVCTYNSGVHQLFGAVKSISIAGKSQTCTVQLPAVSEASNTYPSIITFEGTGDLPIIRKNPADNTDIPGYDNEDEVFHIPLIGVDAETGDVNAGLAGYAMVAPITDTDTVTLIIETEEKGSSTVLIKGPTGGFVAGSSYTLTLEFRTTGIEIQSVTIQDWETDEIIEKEI